MHSLETFEEFEEPARAVFSHVAEARAGVRSNPRANLGRQGRFGDLLEQRARSALLLGGDARRLDEAAGRQADEAEGDARP